VSWRRCAEIVPGSAIAPERATREKRFVLKLADNCGGLDAENLVR
jgi:hypothetical protein